MSLKDELQAVRDLIADPERWTRDHYAVDESGFDVAANSKEAVRWCLVGACARLGVDNSSVYEAAREMYHTSAGKVNDRMGHEAVLKVLDHAIQKAGAR